MFQRLQELRREYHQRYWSVEFSLYRMLVRPATISPGEMFCNDFIILAEICNIFDKKRLALFHSGDRESGTYATETRQGEARSVPLLTVSLTVLSDRNFIRPPHPGQ